MINHVPQLYQCQAIVAAQIENYVKYPPRQKAASFNLDAVMASLHKRRPLLRATNRARQGALTSCYPVRQNC